MIDLTHHVPPFDVRAGGHTLVRAVPHLGPGVCSGWSTPGRHGATGICIEVALAAGGTMHFVGPDNGLLVAAAESAGEAPLARVVELRRDPAAPGAGATFDGRDLFGPVAAALAAGAPLGQLGQAVEPASLVRLPGGVVERGRFHDGRTCLRAEVTWVDHFGNLQLAATVAEAGRGIPTVGSIELAARTESDREDPDGLPHSLVPDGVRLRCVDVFGDLEQGQLGLLADANGHLAVVAREASAASWLNVAAGELVVLAW